MANDTGGKSKKSKAVRFQTFTAGKSKSEAELSYNISGPSALQPSQSLSDGEYESDKRGRGLFGKKKKKEKIPTGPMLNTEQLTSGITLYEGMKNPTEGSGYFKDSLEQTTEDGTRVPILLEQCCKYIEESGIELQGIYRLSGSASKINNLKTKYHQYKDVDVEAEAEAGATPHVVAGVVKSFFREINEMEFMLTKPNRLLTTELATLPDSDAERRLKELTEMVQTLPRPNFVVLRFLIAHLRLVSTHAEKNMMTADNIAIVFAPSTQIPRKLLRIMIEDFDAVFGDSDPAQ